jgi:hypothetical protein
LQSKQKEEEVNRLMKSTDEIKKRLADKEVEVQEVGQEHPRRQD